ncbi:(2Fe-2S) ferredoxin domain-containing protein [Oscillospiraceae bacterium MB08-C2-2]|nr:(2Fe-2S) ferredoxin domain-containing protein [Oscillospiraceae bacterium MB08-C2-2]
MEITVCIGSSCHLKGSRPVVEQLEKLIFEKRLRDRVELQGSFCMGNCTAGVCVQVEGEMFSLKPEDTAVFFEKEVMARL